MDVRARVAVSSHRPGDAVLEIVTRRSEEFDPHAVRELEAEIAHGIGHPVQVLVRCGEVDFERLVWRRADGTTTEPALRPETPRRPGAASLSAQRFQERERALALQHEYISWRTRRGLQPTCRFAKLLRALERAASEGGEGIPRPR